jgi:hypothetical protein
MNLHHSQLARQAVMAYDMANELRRVIVRNSLIEMTFYDAQSH